MRERGYSLVEIIVVIGILSILIVIATPLFTDLMKRARAEDQTRTIYTELQRAQANALYLRRATRVKLYRDHFEIYSSQWDNLKGVAPIQSQVLSYPITCNGSGDGIAGYPVDFDPKGVATIATKRSICLDVGESLGNVDSVVVYTTRISIGKKDKVEDACASENITKK
jgi:prepilin-type N-terminal cleavage/methylation domain-containing protein